jgi:ligand-binding sensor domain-containing protein
VTYTAENSSLPHNDIYDLKKDDQRNLWIASGKSLVQFDGNSFNNLPAPIDPDNQQDFVTTIALDNTGTPWIGTKLSGLFKLNQTTFRQVLKSDLTTTSVEQVARANVNVQNTDNGLIIEVNLTKTTNVTVEIFNTSGQLAKTVLNDKIRNQETQQYNVTLPIGTYFVKYTIDGIAKTVKTTVTK